MSRNERTSCVIVFFALVACCTASCSEPSCFGPVFAENPNSVTSDSCVHLTATPDVIEKDFTDALEVTCHYTGVAPVVSIGIGKKDKGRTSGLAYIVSSKPNDTVWTDQSLKGVLTGAIGIQGTNKAYISIKWTYPSPQDGGEYVCMVSEIPQFGLIKQRETSVFIRATGVTEQRLLQRLDKLESELENLKSSLQREQKSLSVINQALFSISAPYKNRTYHLTEYLPATYMQADAVCQALGGYLAEIDDTAEYDFIVKFIEPRVATKVVVLIAGSDKGHLRKWVFQRTNQTAPVLDWWPGEPNGIGIEHRLSLMSNRQGAGVHMNNMYFPFVPDLQSPYQYGFLCEVPQS